MIPQWSDECLTVLAEADTRILAAYGVPDITPEDPAGEVQELQIQILETSGVPGLAECYRRHIAQSQTASATTLGRMDAVAEFWAVLGEPLGLGDEQLPAYGVPEPGCCRICLRGPLYIPVRRGPLRTPSLCIYCHALQQMATGPGTTRNMVNLDPPPRVTADTMAWRRNLSRLMVLIAVISWTVVILCLAGVIR